VARFYADEQFPKRVVQLLRDLGHDVLTVQEAGRANLKIPDEEVLAFAVRIDRAVLTLNRRDFFRLHRSQPDHAGIVACKDDDDKERMAARINEAISTVDSLRGQLIRVVRPQQ
jgi:predicted nuclease of predicted toxin-antitoxin system